MPPAVGVVGIYCNYTKATVGMQNLSYLLGSLCQQLTKPTQNLMEKIMDLYECRTEGCPPSTKQLLGLLEAEISEFKQVFIVVDGLDEYPENGETQSELISHLRKLQPRASLLVTSRDLGNIEMLFKADPKLRIIASDEDLYLYV
jgi:hypothetical protein